MAQRIRKTTVALIRELRQPRIWVKELSPGARSRLLKHFLALEPSDRLLRFGSHLSDESITRYVEGINFERDTVFGVYNSRLRLMGVGHLTFAPSEKSAIAGATLKARVAEFGVSVDASARGLGVGSRLFQRASMRCRNADIDTLYMHCLSSNKVMLHIARKAGMEIHRDYGESDAYLKILPADASSVMQEALAEQAAMLDYTFKSNLRLLLRAVARLTGTGRRK
ncbi:GNAT family N-acetyltransferase [Herbaspirillum sp. RTI4]|uniref:GNAT family N-acetyltransferase n=1 Tax=Herbaspirillum sp. RTI4 TaxID=3048640 RepID=UPI002AB56775|nr:GNAT family N-acetyltransferase [Herbaspirillum sp. RTI4]MDY7576915.1 GNAT family N-acetyltransferase [Herbaspirillum sp. RTI4]MEA9983214.1 GNAT family N-acetyltransferase [Herbaspirillum sp. RTI4]